MYFFQNCGLHFIYSSKACFPKRFVTYAYVRYDKKRSKMSSSAVVHNLHGKTLKLLKNVLKSCPLSFFENEYNLTLFDIGSFGTVSHLRWGAGA